MGKMKESRQSGELITICKQFLEFQDQASPNKSHLHATHDFLYGHAVWIPGCVSTQTQCAPKPADLRPLELEPKQVVKTEMTLARGWMNEESINHKFVTLAAYESFNVNLEKGRMFVVSINDG